MLILNHVILRRAVPSEAVCVKAETWRLLRFARSDMACHCEERSDEAISLESVGASHSLTATIASPLNPAGGANVTSL